MSIITIAIATLFYLDTFSFIETLAQALSVFTSLLADQSRF